MEGYTSKPDLESSELAAIFETARLGGSRRDALDAVVAVSHRNRDKKTIYPLFNVALEFWGLGVKRLVILTAVEAGAIAERARYEMKPDRVFKLRDRFVLWRGSPEESGRPAIDHRTDSNHQRSLVALVKSLRSNMRAPSPEDALVDVLAAPDASEGGLDALESAAQAIVNSAKPGPKFTRLGGRLQVSFYAEDSPKSQLLLQHLEGEGFTARFKVLETRLKDFGVLCWSLRGRVGAADMKEVPEVAELYAELGSRASQLSAQMDEWTLADRVPGTCQVCSERPG